MLTYPGNMKDDYILARVTKVHPDGKGLVRRVTVKFRKKNSREPKDTCKSKMVEEVVAVQRLVLLEPAPRPDASTALNASSDIAKESSGSAPGPVTRSKARASPHTTPCSASPDLPPSAI